VPVRAGERLKQLRLQLGLTAREVAELSRKIAVAEANDEFAVSHARLIQIENDESTPSIYKLFALSAIYGRSFTGLVSFYLDLANLAHHTLNVEIAATRPVDLEAYDGNRPVSFPVRFDPGFQPGKTSLLSRMVKVWGEVPVALLETLRVRKSRYGLIGLEDFTMYPLLPRAPSSRSTTSKSRKSTYLTVPSTNARSGSWSCEPGTSAPGANCGATALSPSRIRFPHAARRNSRTPTRRRSSEE
jgi:transcriptional regulator with XRE-family HTH domain